MDYKLEYQAFSTGGDWETLETTLTAKTYTAISLTTGVVYKFRVYARNAIGYSSASAEVEILAAQIPDKPDAPITVYENTAYVLIDWVAPNE